MNIKDLKEAISADRIVASRHSRREAAAGNLVLGEIVWSVVEEGKVIEEYPNAYPMPACLILGFNTVGAPIHSVWSYDQVSRTARLVTVYRPDTNRWIDWRMRK
jgi:hypothetical protein